MIRPKVLFIKTHKDAKTPNKKYPGDVGYDLYALRDEIIKLNTSTIIYTGVRIALPKGYYAEIHTRSSQGLVGLRNHLGIVDEGYRGEICPIIMSHSYNYQIRKGQKIAQLIIKKREEVEFKEVDFIPSSERGENGFGSTGR